MQTLYELELPKSLVPDLVEAFSNSWRQTEEFPKPRRSLSAFVSAARLGGSQIKENRERADRRERRERQKMERLRMENFEEWKTEANSDLVSRPTI